MISDAPQGHGPRRPTWEPPQAEAALASPYRGHPRKNTGSGIPAPMQSKPPRGPAARFSLSLSLRLPICKMGTGDCEDHVSHLHGEHGV